MKVVARIAAVIGVVTSAGLIASVAQVGPQLAGGGVVRSVDQVRPTGVKLSKRKQGRPGVATATRVPVLALPAPRLEPVSTPATVVVTAETRHCGCPVSAATPLRGAAADHDAAVMLVVRRICAELDKAEVNAPSEDLEARIAYALDQSRAAKDVQVDALALFGADGCGPRNLLAALTQVRGNLLRNGADQGTAGIVNGGFGPSTTAFSSPQVSIGGGSVNYAN